MLCACKRGEVADEVVWDLDLGVWLRVEDLLLGVYCVDVGNGRVDVVGEEGPGVVSLRPVHNEWQPSW